MAARPPFFTARSVLEGRSSQCQAGGKVRTSAAYCLSGMVIPSRRPLLETTRRSSSYIKRPARVAVTTRATKANVAGQFGGWRAPTVPHPAQSSPTSKGNCFKLQTNRLPSGVKHRLARNCQSDPFRHRRLHGGSALLSIPGSTSESAEAQQPFGLNGALWLATVCGYSTMIRLVAAHRL